MKMRFKAVLCTVLAAAMLLSVLPVFAEETTAAGPETTTVAEETSAVAEEPSAADETTTAEETTAASSANEGRNHLCDVNGSGNISVYDARKALRAAVALDKLTETEMGAADADFDKKITVEDARSILRVAIRLDTVYSLVKSKNAVITAENGNKHSVTYTFEDVEYSFTENCIMPSAVRKNPTCVDNGEIESVCADCGNRKTEYIAKLGHDYKGEIKANNDGTHSVKCVNGCDDYSKPYTCVYTVTNTQEATCTLLGITEKTCKYCGYACYDYSPRLEHSFTNYVSDNNASWSADGTKTAKCDNPGCTATKTIIDTGSRLTTGDIPSSTKVLFMTFDDGPSKYTNQIISILDQYDCQATWFVVNSSYTSGYKAIVDSGNVIALHSYTHNYSYIYSSTYNFYTDLQNISDKVYNLTGVRSYLHRFPGGSSNTISKYYCTGIMSSLTNSIGYYGYRYFDWNSANDDATGESLTAYQIYCRAIQYAGTSNRLVMLMHDTDAKGTTVSALPSIIEYYQARGYVCLGLDMDSPTCHHSVWN